MSEIYLERLVGLLIGARIVDQPEVMKDVGLLVTAKSVLLARVTTDVVLEGATKTVEQKGVVPNSALLVEQKDVEPNFVLMVEQKSVEPNFVLLAEQKGVGTTTFEIDDSLWINGLVAMLSDAEAAFGAVVEVYMSQTDT